MAVMAAFCADASDHIIRTAGLLIVTNDAEVVTPSTIGSGQTGAPADMPDPVFWLDASDTNGWTLVKDGAYTRVRTVPSKGVSARYATVDVSAENGDTWYAWGNDGQYPPLMPYLVDDDSLLPGKVLDFVRPGSSGTSPMIGLVFDRVPETEGAAPTNAIFNIGTVIAVYGSHDGRGWFLGGGRAGKAYDWHRGYSQMKKGNAFDWTAGVAGSFGSVNAAQRNGTVRHGGIPTSPLNVGFNHAWEVVSWTMESATAVATGIGLGDTRAPGFERTGQQRIAEMLIFDSVLPVETIEKIETYLNGKWFGRKIPGYGGNAELGTLRSITTSSYSSSNSGIETVVDVPEDESLTIGRVEGGRGLKSVIRKTGAGPLALRDASDYGGRIALAGGTLSVPRRKIPSSVDHIVTNCYYHADASVASGIVLSEEDGIEYVMGWKNLTDGTFMGDPVMLAPIGKARRPQLVRNALGEGKHIVDFMPYGHGTSTARYLSFTTNAATASSYSSELGVNGIVTVVAVYGARGSGGSLFNKKMWNRPKTGVDTYLGWANVDMFDTGVADENRGFGAADAVVYADGVRLDPSSWFAKPGYQVLAVKSPGCDSVARFGCSSSQGMGGFTVAELFIFKRHLTETEVRDLSAYLAYKWFGNEINGYEAESPLRTAPDIAELDVEEDSAFSVATGRVVRVGKASVSANLEVTGGGTLEIGELSVSRDASVTATDATVVVTGPADPETDAEIAADPAFRLDPSDTVNFEFEPSNGTNFVSRARDAAMKHELFAPSAARSPWLDTTVFSSELPVLNFGAYGYYGDLMAFDRPIDSVRSVYVIWAPNDDVATHLAFMFGSTDRMSRDPLGGRLYDYHPETEPDANGFLPLFSAHGPSAHVNTGEIYVDGVRTNRYFTPKAGEPRLIELHHKAPAHIAGLATDRGTVSGRNGGSVFGETLIYTRVLSEREKVATRNYLMKKWFGKTDEELAPLPDGPDAKLNRLSGEGSFVKTGGNTLAAGDIGSYTGTVTVAEGTLKVTRPLPAAVPALVTDGLVFHVDANRGIEFVEGTENSVKKWNSVLGDGWSAVSANAFLETPVNSEYPALLEGMHDGTPFVRMLHNKGHYMVFCKDGVRSRIKNIRTVFWVLGTDDGTGSTLGGGFLLGGGNDSDPDTGTSRWVWHRGNDSTGASRGSYGDPLVSGSAFASVRSAKWYMNGVETDGFTTGLGSNSWHYITAVPSPQTENPATADGFAFDGRWLEGNTDLQHRTGGQSLAEVLIYDRTLTDEERVAVEAHLAVKWGFSQRQAVNSVDLEIAEGATFDCGGHLQYVASVSGTGTVEGDISVGRVIADTGATEWPVINGSFVQPEEMTIELRNLPESLNGLKIKLFECDGFTGAGEDAVITFAGETVYDGVRIRLSYSDGALYLRFRSLGTVVILK